MDDELFEGIIGIENSLRTLLSSLKSIDIPTPVLDSTLSYLIGLRREKLSVNLIQALRDKFGYHGFGRIDVAVRVHLD